MEKEEIEAALSELAAEADRRGIRSKIFLVGGMVMVVVFDSRTGTADVDGAASDVAVYDVAHEVGERRGLPRGWINDAAKVFIPLAKEPNWRPVLVVGGIEIVAADERTMLAMKLWASRTRDLPDVRFLLGECGITTEDEALALYQEYFPEDPLKPWALDLLGEALTHTPRVDRGPAIASPHHRHRWFIAKKGRVAHVVSTTTLDHLVITDCGKSFSVAGARMGTGGSPAGWCPACRHRP